MWVKFYMFWVQNLFFEEISRSFCIIFGQETHEHVTTIKKRCLEVRNVIFGFQTTFFYGFNVLMSFLAEI